MIIYGSIIVSFFIVILFYLFNRDKITWWEFFIPILSSLIIVFLFKLITDSSRVNFSEYWGDNVSYVVEQEPYNYWKTETCSKQVPCGTDKDGNTKYCTEYYDCSHQEDVGPRWYCVTTRGESYNIEEKIYDKLKIQFNSTPKIVDIHKNYDSNDKCVYSSGTKFENKYVGDYSNTYMCLWKGDDNSAKPIFTQHSYVNKIKASDLTIFNIKSVSEKQADSLKLFKYPEYTDLFSFPTILGDNVNDDIGDKFKKINGKFGTRNKLRFWLLIYKDKPFKTAIYQENYWVKGNKNELIVCIGIDNKRNIKWVHSFSWAKSNTLTSEVSQKINDFKILNDSTYIEYYKYLNSNLSRFEKRSFKEFDYLTVEPSNWQMITCYIISVIVSILCCIWAIKNDID